MHRHGVRGTNSNIMGKHWSKWWGVECDLVNDAGVFLAKGHVVACDLHEALLNDQLREKHVRFCILYCPTIVLVVVTICKWSSVQTILDEYPFIKHLIVFHETHIPNVDDVGAVSVKKKKIFS
jgi:hypothetical protein